MQRRGGELGVTPFGVACTVNQTSHLRPSYCAGAHVARFNGYVNRAFRKIFSAKIVCRRSNGLHFCVCRNIVQGFRHVVCATNDPVLANHHCSHRNFVLVGCKLGFGNGKPHVFFVIVCFHVANIQQKGENPKNAAADLVAGHLAKLPIFIRKVTDAVQEEIKKGKMDYDVLAYNLCISRAQLNRKIKAITGYTTTEFILQIRISLAKKLLDMTAIPICEVALKCGMDNYSYFCTLFKKSTGMTPLQYKSRRDR